MPVVLFATTSTIAGSAFSSLRIPVGGAQMHPFMIPVGVLAVAVALPGLHLIPLRLRVAAVLFFGLYLFSMLQGGGGMASEVLKLGASIAAIAAFAVAVARSDAHTAVTLGLSIAAALMSFKGLTGPTVGLTGLNPLEMANKNAFSLYALPALLVGGHYVLERTDASRLLRVAVVACMLTTVVALFSTANRSGWLGVLLIGTMLFVRGRSVRTTALAFALALGAYFLVARFSATDVIEHRIAQTQGSYESDTGRKELFREALVIGLENPLLGVSPQQLPYHLARRLRMPGDVIDPHNVFGHLLGGSGFLTMGALGFLGYCMWTRRPARSATSLSAAARSAHALLRMIIVLWIVRGMFSREILYNPSFAAAIGLAIGLCIREGMWRPRPRKVHG